MGNFPSGIHVHKLYLLTRWQTRSKDYQKTKWVYSQDTLNPNTIDVAGLPNMQRKNMRRFHRVESNC